MSVLLKSLAMTSVCLRIRFAMLDLCRGRGYELSSMLIVLGCAMEKAWWELPSISEKQVIITMIYFLQKRIGVIGSITYSSV